MRNREISTSYVLFKFKKNQKLSTIIPDLSKIMLYSQTKFTVKDNSGIIVAQVIQTQRSKRSQKPCGVGDYLKGTVCRSKTRSSNKSLSLSNVLFSFLVIKTRKSLRRPDGSALRLNENSGVTFNDKKVPLFKRVNSLVPFELKKVNPSVLTLAKTVI